MKRIDIFEENRRLKEELNHEKRLCKEWQKRYYNLEKKVIELESKLNILFNSNTPSSQLPFTEKDTNLSPNRNKKGSKPLGKPKGGNGGCRQPPQNVDRKLKATLDRCPCCNHHKLKNIGIEEVYVWDLPVVKLIVTLFYRYIYNCKKCGSKVYGVHPDLPSEGMIGPNLTAFLTEVRQNFAGSYEKLSSFLKDITGETFSRQAIKDCIKRVSFKLKPSYDEMKDKLQNEEVVNSDETKWPINGQHNYLWLFCTLNFVFITINKSRGRKVITNILGDLFKGVVVSDCLSVYNTFASAFQKCWSHLLRKTYWLKEKNPKKDISKLHKQLSSLYEEAETFRKTKLNKSQRIWNTILLTQKIEKIEKYNWKSNEAKGIIKNWITKYKGQWLVGIMMPEVELTNNKDERGIRKVIPTRKMLGGHRTVSGANDFAILETHRQTWKQNGKSPYLELSKFLIEKNIQTIV